MSELWEESWEHDFPNIDRDNPGWLGFANVYRKGFESGYLLHRGPLNGPHFDAENIPQPPAHTRVRANDPDTSWEAALSVSKTKTAALYALIYQALSAEALGATDEQLVRQVVQHATFKVTPSGIRSRRAELVRAGWVRDSGVRDTISTGRKAVCWEAVS